MRYETFRFGGCAAPQAFKVKVENYQADVEVPISETLAEALTEARIEA